MDRLEKAKVHKAIDDVLTDHHPGMRATRVMIRELILDALEAEGLTICNARVELDKDVTLAKPHPLDYGKAYVDEQVSATTYVRKPWGGVARPGRD